MYKTLWTGAGSGLLISLLEKLKLVSFDQSNNTDAIDVKMDGSVLEEKSSFKMLGLTFSSKLDWGSYIISIAKTTLKNIGALICSMKFQREFHVWAGAPSCYLELLDKLQKPICRTIGPSLAGSLEPVNFTYSGVFTVNFEHISKYVLYTGKRKEK